MNFRAKTLQKKSAKFRGLYTIFGVEIQTFYSYIWLFYSTYLVVFDAKFQIFELYSLAWWRLEPQILKKSMFIRTVSESITFFKVWFFPIFRTFSKSKQKLPFVNIQFITTEGFLADLPPSEVVLCMNFSKTSQHFHLHFSRKTSEK